MDDIEERVAYYNKLSLHFGASDAPLVSEIESERGRYFLDLIEHAKGFGADRRLNYLFGDIKLVPPVPKIVKSRPISDSNENSVVLNLNKNRHFSWTPDPIPFRDKKPAAVWRGTARTKARRILADKFYDHPEFGIGHTGKEVSGRRPKGALTHGQQKQFKYFISLEGNEVATNLTWGMASNMLVMSPRLHYETWFMEGRLQPDKHFVLLRDDFSDLEDKVAYYNDNPEAAEAIISEAHRWLDQFSDPLKERMIGARVLQKYFLLSGQI
ncbi:glycosyl transferase family 90 [Ruegeria atlantica]|uniref:glycosyl transferase family 90 n=1 Tax=Ruegeria atlantica TaxID=81569 RepID=UPI00147B1DE7|nr:glycosyl transferase family 90 [Ruegeria atlantica]